jgi:hypothetical protein
MPFGNFISLQRGHDLPEQERIKGDVPILGSFGVTGWHNKSLAKAPGLTIGRSGASFGTATYTERDYFPLNTTLYVTDFKGNHPKFAYYFAEQFDFSSFNSGSAQPSLNRNFINPVEVRIPPLAEQKTIAHILGTLDDKIELNRKTNETLEAMAKALFKSWFVDFDPVRAKAEGRSTGLPAKTSDLFQIHLRIRKWARFRVGGRSHRLAIFAIRLAAVRHLAGGKMCTKGEHSPLSEVRIFTIKASTQMVLFILTMSRRFSYQMSKFFLMMF